MPYDKMTHIEWAFEPEKKILQRIHAWGKRISMWVFIQLQNNGMKSLLTWGQCPIQSSTELKQNCACIYVEIEQASSKLS